MSRHGYFSKKNLDLDVDVPIDVVRRLRNAVDRYLRIADMLEAAHVADVKKYGHPVDPGALQRSKDWLAVAKMLETVAARIERRVS